MTLGLMKLNYCECDNDWGLFVVLDEEEEKQVSYRKMLLKNVIQMETIEEGECEEYYDVEKAYGNKIEYYRNSAITLSENGRYRDQNEETKEQEQEKNQDQDQEKDQDQEDYKNLVKEKIHFLITYMFTASFSMALIILTFTI
jgi:hypothetical protein